MFRKISHVGLAVKNLDRAIQFYQDVLQMKVSGRKKVESQGVEMAFVDVGGSAQLELIAPLREDGSVARFIEKRGPGIHHICVEVEDIEKEIAHLLDNGVTMIDQEPRTGASGDRIAFIHPKSMIGALIELKEVKK